MEKIIDFANTVYEIINKYPETKNILANLGFKKITNPVALNSMGKIMTIPKGAQVMNISLDKIIKNLEDSGFSVIDSSKNEQGKKREQKLVNYLQRLNNGEKLETVQKDFAKDFENVSVQEIMNAEQNLIDNGENIKDVQKLCDLHSALFHGKNESEISGEETKKRLEQDKTIKDPLDILILENRELEKILKNNNIQEILKNLAGLKTHYSKKYELIYPMLSKYGIDGPREVMWAVDDEIVKDIKTLSKKSELNETDIEKFNKTKQRITDIIYKEENILFPMCRRNFIEDDFLEIYADFDEMGIVWLNPIPKWDKGEKYILETESKNYTATSDKITFSTGELNITQLIAIFDTLPADITFIDENDILRFFTNKLGIFARPKTALGRKVYLCHPARVIPMVKKVITEFKEGKKNIFEFTAHHGDKNVRVRYMAVHDKNGKYIGTMEVANYEK